MFELTNSADTKKYGKYSSKLISTRRSKPMRYCSVSFSRSFIVCIFAVLTNVDLSNSNSTDGSVSLKLFSTVAPALFLFNANRLFRRPIPNLPPSFVFRIISCFIFGNKALTAMATAFCSTFDGLSPKSWMQNFKMCRIKRFIWLLSKFSSFMHKTSSYSLAKKSSKSYERNNKVQDERIYNI